MRVLLATDGSDDASTATAWLARFPIPANSHLRVVSAVSIPPSALDLPTVREFEASLRESARQTAEAARTALAHRRTLRAHLREERAFQRALAGAPTLESAHEIVALSARR